MMGDEQGRRHGGGGCSESDRRRCFRNARHHLAAATRVLNQYGAELEAVADKASEQHQAKCGYSPRAWRAGALDGIC